MKIRSQTRPLRPSRALFLPVAIALALGTACTPRPKNQAAEQPAEAAQTAASETPDAAANPAIPVDFRALGTEPFWGAHVSAEEFHYNTPENIEGETFPATRSEENGVVTIAGTMGEKPFSLRVAVESCSDGMSDRVYPFVAELEIGEETRRGCARPSEG